MKFRMTMKDPNTLVDAISDAVKELPLSDLPEDEREMVRDERADKVRGFCVEKWFRWGEYVTLEIDTDAQTCVVVENGN